MKKIALYSLQLILLLFLSGFTAEESSIDGRPKQKINFYGTLTTWNDKVYTVENISIGRLYKQIPVFEAPSTQPATKEKRKLSTNPQTGSIITRIDLAEIAELRVPRPESVWTYQKDKKGSKTEYIELEVISNNSTKTKTTYLIELTKKVFCDGINEAGPEEKDVPLQALKSLKIEGYKERALNEKECATTCAPCKVKNSNETAVLKKKQK